MIHVQCLSVQINNTVVIVTISSYVLHCCYDTGQQTNTDAKTRRPIIAIQYLTTIRHYANITTRLTLDMSIWMIRSPYCSTTILHSPLMIPVAPIAWLISATIPCQTANSMWKQPSKYLSIESKSEHHMLFEHTFCFTFEHRCYVCLGSNQKLTVGPANREVPESAIAAHPPAQNPAKSQMEPLLSENVNDV